MVNVNENDVKDITDPSEDSAESAARPLEADKAPVDEASPDEASRQEPAAEKPAAAGKESGPRGPGFQCWNKWAATLSRLPARTIYSIWDTMSSTTCSTLKAVESIMMASGAGFNGAVRRVLSF